MSPLPLQYNTCVLYNAQLWTIFGVNHGTVHKLLYSHLLGGGGGGGGHTAM